MHIIQRLRVRDDRGAAALEFALVLLPLLMIISGIINFGAVFSQQLALDNSVRAGARAGVVDRGALAPTPATVALDQLNSTAFARGQLVNPIITPSRSTTPVGSLPGTTCVDSTFGQNFVLEGRVTAKLLIPWPIPVSIISSSVTLSSKAEFQCEYK